MIVTDNTNSSGRKLCPDCGVDKNHSDFHANKARYDGLQSVCKPCLIARNASYAKSHKLEIAVSLAKWVDRNREKINAQSRVKRLRNLEKSKAAFRNWAKRNHHATAAQAAYRRAFVKNATPAWVDRAVIKEIYLASSHISDISGIPHEVDHIYPLIHDKFSGLHVPWNLQILTASANRSKGNRICP